MQEASFQSLGGNHSIGNSVKPSSYSQLLHLYSSNSGFPPLLYIPNHTDSDSLLVTSSTFFKLYTYSFPFFSNYTDSPIYDTPSAYIWLPYPSSLKSYNQLLSSPLFLSFSFLDLSILFLNYQERRLKEEE